MADFLGLATVITPSAAFHHSTIGSIDVVELCGMVVYATGDHFWEYNASGHQISFFAHRYRRWAKLHLATAGLARSRDPSGSNYLNGDKWPIL